MTGENNPIYQLPCGRSVKIQNIAPCWNGRIGRCIRWVHDSWYIVKVDTTELVLDESRSEFTLV
jgi:hypothetical protein